MVSQGILYIRSKRKRILISLDKNFLFASSYPSGIFFHLIIISISKW